MEDIFFNIVYSSLPDMLTKIFVFFAVFGFLLYIIYFALTKILFLKSSLRKELCLRLTLLWAIFSCFIVFIVYLFVLFYRNGPDSMLWSNPKFYPGIMAQLLIFAGFIIFFYIKRYSLKKIINDNSIN